MIIEFIGLPSSGKTTIAKEIFKMGTIDNKKVIYPLLSVYNRPWFKRNLHKAWSVFSYFVKHPKRAFNFIKVLRYYGQKKRYDYFRLTFNNLYLFAIQAKYKDSNDICIFDEGSIHHVWAITTGTRKMYQLTDFFQFYSSADIVVNVEASTASLRKRTKERISENNYKNLRHDFMVSNSIEEKKRINNILKEAQSFASPIRSTIITLENNSFDLLIEHREKILKVIHEKLNL